MDTSPTTAIGLFDDYAEAERVAQDLTREGIPRESVEVRSNFMTGAAGRSEQPHAEKEGGISGFFHRLFGSHDDEYSGHYAEAVRRGSTVVCVTAPSDRIDDVVKIMNEHGAIDVDRRVETYREHGYERYDPNAPAYSFDEARNERGQYADRQTGGSIPVVEEQLQVGKRVIRRGGVRVYSHVVEQPVDESVTLLEEHVRVERRPVDRPAADADLSQFHDQSIEVTEEVEEPVVQKTARVREEVVVGKEQSQRTQQIRDKVRRTEVQVENLSADAMNDFRRDYNEHFANSGLSYEAMQPAYEYGYRTASEPRYKGRNWSDVEQTLQTDYMRNNPNSSWERVKGAVRYGWEQVTGKR